MTTSPEPFDLLLLFAVYLALLFVFLWHVLRSERARRPTTVRRRHRPRGYAAAVEGVRV